MDRPARNLIGFIITVFLLAYPGASQAQLVLYDDFTASKIDPARWDGYEDSAGPLAPSTELSRKTASLNLNRQLQMLLTSYGRTDSNSGTGGFPSVGLGVNNPGPVTAMQANVTVKGPTAQGCTANLTATRTRALVVGGFFNDGSSPGAGDRTGDILAGIQKFRDSSSGNRIEAFIVRCTDAPCSWPPATVAFHVFATVWAVGVADTLRLQWDPAADRFLFTRNPGAQGEEIASLSYSGFPDDDPPVMDFKDLVIGNSVANCTAGRKRASMTAFFDDVMLNPEAVP